MTVGRFGVKLQMQSVKFIDMQCFLSKHTSY